MLNNKLKMWIEKGLNDKINTERIFINNHSKVNIDFKLPYINIKYILSHHISRLYSKNMINSIIDITNYIDNENILKSNLNDNFFLIENDNHINILFEIIQTRNLSRINEIKFIYVEKIDFETVLKYKNEELKRFIEHRESIFKKLFKIYNPYCYEDLEYYLNFYYDKKILVAGFAQRLYRLCSLNFHISSDRIGTKIREIIGIKSKTVSLVIFNKRKNVRVYNLNYDKEEYKIKIDIAKKLILLNSKELNVKKITDLIELPLKKVEQLYSNTLLK